MPTFEAELGCSSARICLLALLDDRFGRIRPCFDPAAYVSVAVWRRWYWMNSDG